MKKNKKNRSNIKRKQKQALKAQRRRKEFAKAKLAEVTIHWDDFEFLENWKSLTPQDLLNKVFQLDVEEWIELYPRPKKDKEFLDLQDPTYVGEWVNETMDDTLKAWASDTNGFTEKIPERWQFTEKNQTLFISMMKSELEEWDDEVERTVIELMNNDRPEWFSVVFNDMLNDMVEIISNYITSQVVAWSRF